jgi:hypothetical protein
LLAQIFDLNEATRITVDGIKKHPWFVKPLLPQYQAALQELAEMQVKIESKAEAGQFRVRGPALALACKFFENRAAVSFSV